MLELAKSITNIPTILKNAETHCMILSCEIMKASSDHFNRTESHFEDGSLINTYYCNIDNRNYIVKITPQ